MPQTLKSVRLENFSGSELVSHLEHLAELRISVFREWPYLYDGNLDYEKKYLNTYIRSSRSFACLAFSDDALVGATTAILASDEEDAFRLAFEQRGFSPDEVCYFGESILLPSFRGQGLGREFMTRRLAFAASISSVKYASFCAVARDSSHPRCPANYRPLDEFWKSTGFRPVEGMTTEYSWQDLGEPYPSKKKMQFWLRSLERQGN